MGRERYGFHAVGVRKKGYRIPRSARDDIASTEHERVSYERKKGRMRLRHSQKIRLNLRRARRGPGT